MATEAKLAPGAIGDSGKEICRAFRNTGSCRFEGECKYEHTAGTKIDVPPREYVPKGDCHNWTEKGECRFADRCRFVHGTEDKRHTYRPERKTTETGEQEICHNFQTRGRCRWGEKCRHKHVAPENGAVPAETDGERRRQRRRRGGRKPAAAAAAGEAKTSASAPAKRAPAARPPRTIQVDKDGKEVCRKNLAGTCENGTECKYSHEAVAGTAPAPARAPAASAPAPAAEGAAAAGGAARRRPRRRGPRRARDGAAPAEGAAPAAPRPERECQDFAQGECSYGDDCKFKHGPSDTRDLAAIRRVKREAARKAAAERKAAEATATA